MRWQRVARWGIAAAGVGVAVWLYVATRERPTSTRTSTGTVADPQAAVQAGPGQQIRYRDGDRRQFVLEYASLRQLNDGRTLLDKVKMTLEDGTVLVADETETRGSMAAEDLPAELLLRRHVRMTTPEGAVVESDDATYQSATGRATMPGAVSFTRGRVSGKGMGGSYERETGVFTLLADASLTLAPAEGKEPVTATGASLTFNRAGKALLLDRDARIVTTSSTMTSERATLYLTDDEQQFRVIELRNQARVTPAEGAANSPDMKAVDIDLAFHEGTQALERAVLTRDAVLVVADTSGRQSISAAAIVAEMALDGRTLTLLDARGNVDVRTPAKDGAPERQTTAATLVAKGDPKKGLTSADFAGGVVFVETMPGARGRASSERRATSQTLSMALGGRLDAIDEARFRRDVTFKDGDVSGESDLGTYRAAKGQLTLEPSSPPGKKAPHVSSGDVDVDATDRIDVDLASRDLHAVGTVKTVTRRAANSRAGGNAIFDGDEPTHGFGREFWYTGKNGGARYVGTAESLAIIRQGERQVAAESVEADRDGGNLKASGHVDSTLLLDSTAGSQRGGTTTRYRITADTLDYAESRRTAVYTGTPATPAVLTATDGVTKGRRVVLTLARESRTLERLTAETDVSLSLNGGREGLADALTYEAATERYSLRGRPLVLRAPDEKPDVCSEWRARTAYFTRSSRVPDFPEAEQGGSSVASRSVSCKDPLKR